jgi:hypothetical protein
VAELEFGQEGLGGGEAGGGAEDGGLHAHEGGAAGGEVGGGAGGAGGLVLELLDVIFCEGDSPGSLREEGLVGGNGSEEVCDAWVDDIEERLVAVGVGRGAQEAGGWFCWSYYCFRRLWDSHTYSDASRRCRT